MTLDLADLEGFGTVVVTSADVTGRPVGKRVSVDVFRRIVHEGIPLSSCVLGWDVDQWPGPVQEYTGHHTGWHDVRAGNLGGEPRRDGRLPERVLLSVGLWRCRR
jgi:hypothetical protein